MEDRTYREAGTQPNEQRRQQGYRDDEGRRGRDSGDYPGQAHRESVQRGDDRSNQRDAYADQDRDGDDYSRGDSHYRGYYQRSSTPYWSPRGGAGSLVVESWMLTGPYSGKGPKGYQRSKEQIVEEASQRLQRHGEIDASDIEVSCEDGVLTLKGEVEDRQTKRAAEECVESIYGIGDVMNELRIKRNTDRDASKDDAKDREEAKSRS